MDVMQVNHAMFSLMADQPLERLKSHANQKQPAALTKLLKQEYLPAAETSLAPGSAASQEHAAVSSDNVSAAASLWRRLSKAQQAKVKQAVEQAGGEGQLLEEELDLEAPMPRPGPD